MPRTETFQQELDRLFAADDAHEASLPDLSHLHGDYVFVQDAGDDFPAGLRFSVVRTDHVGRDFDEPVVFCYEEGVSSGSFVMGPETLGEVAVRREKMKKPNQYRNTIAVELLAALTRLVVRAPPGARCWRAEDPAPDADPELLYINLPDGRTFSVSLEEA